MVSVPDNNVNNIESTTSIHKILLNSGLATRWQIVMMISSFATIIHTAIFTVAHTFYVINVPYTCADDNSSQNVSLEDMCSRGCSNWRFDYSDLDISTSLQESYILVCEKEILIKVHGTLFFLGLLLGSIIGGYLSDRIGRVRTLVLCFFIHTVSGVIMALCQSIIIHFVAWVAINIVNITTWLVVFVYASEVSPLKYRHYIIILFSLGFALGTMGTAPLNILFPNWRHMILANCCIAFISFIAVIFFDESPIWLWSTERYEETCLVVKSAVKFSGEKLSLDTIETLDKDSRDGLKKETFFASLKTDMKRILNMKTAQIQEKSENCDIVEIVERHYSLLDIFRHRRLSVRLLLLSILWVAANTFGYGILFGASVFKQESNLHLYIVLNAVTSVIGTSVSLIGLNFFGRKSITITSFCLTGLMFGGCVLSPSDAEYAMLTFATLAHLTSATLFNLCYLWTAELMPTVVRSSGTGFCSMISRVTGLALPYVILLTEIWEKLPIFFYCLFALLVMVCSLLLPETRGKNLPKTLEEGNVFGTKWNVDQRTTTSTDDTLKDGSTV